MDVGCTAVCWSLNASTFIILFDMYIQHFPFHILLPSLFPLFLVETWEPISLGFHTLTPGMPQRLLVKLLVLFACFFFRQQPLGALVSMHPSTVWPARRIPRLLSYIHFLSRNYTFSP